MYLFNHSARRQGGIASDDRMVNRKLYGRKQPQPSLSQNLVTGNLRGEINERHRNPVRTANFRFKL